MSEENINLTISGMLNVRKDIPKEEYENFDAMVKSYIDETEGVLTNIKINGKEIPLKYYNEIKGAFFEGGETIELEFSSKKEVLKDLLDKLLKADSEAERVEIDKNINYKIAEFTNNILILNILETISSLMTYFIEDARLKIIQTLKVDNLLEEMHKNIVNSIISGDKNKARKAMKEHFNNVYLSIENNEEFDN